jgi:sterol desaturase/sphingolipid hydroxylase (fatty acid hydroxylase superfamily)
VLWGLHALHHSDPELDITTTLRHHPGEAFLTAIVIGLGGAALGLSPWVIGLYGSLDLSIQFLAHANVYLPERLSAKFGRVVVTPDLHAIHHSRAAADFGANFGAVFSVWDRLFRTYRKEPHFGFNRLELGIDAFRHREFQRFDRMLMLPLLIFKARHSEPAA